MGSAALSGAGLTLLLLCTQPKHPQGQRGDSRAVLRLIPSAEGLTVGQSSPTAAPSEPLQLAAARICDE